ncbi:SDR family oxidoreductase [Actinoplanes sp. NPDC051411]|uniref:SDR family oxidoreductase n=1 Tax=Actinoplanes sp. NPDC051411 TaxID=3155522 RepID=UPI00342CD2B8
MSIVVTGATGQLGRLVVESLLAKGVPAADIVGVGRDIDKIADLGITTRKAAYEDVEALKAAFAGADAVLLISGSEVGKRVDQHRNAIQAAKEVGVGRIIYTSISNAGTSAMKLAAEHQETERLLAESGVPHTLLRNSWYIENYPIAQAVEHGLFGAAGDGRISASPRLDYAEAAAAALIGEGHAGKVYELGGEAFTMPELAAEIARQSGREVTYTDLGEEKYTEFLVGVGLDASYAAVLADSDSAASRGDLFVPKTDLEGLIGRPATPLAESVAAALRQ